MMDSVPEVPVSAELLRLSEQCMGVANCFAQAPGVHGDGGQPRQHIKTLRIGSEQVEGRLPLLERVDCRGFVSLPAGRAHGLKVIEMAQALFPLRIPWLQPLQALQKHNRGSRSEEHTSELQSQSNIVCR